jgi:integrase
MPNPSKGAHLIIKRGKGKPDTWYIKDGTTQRSTRRARADLDGAQKELASYIAQKFRPDTRVKPNEDILVAEVLLFYFNNLPSSSRSKQTISYNIQALSDYWVTKSIADIRGSECRQYVASRRVSAATARQELKTLQAAVNFWHRESPLTAVPKVTLPAAHSRRERVLERWEVAAMLRAARRLSYHHVTRFILIGLYTGTRHATILELQWCESDTGGHIDLERATLYRRGANDRETTKRRPPVRITPRLLGHLRRWHKRREVSSFIVHYRGKPIAKMKKAWNHVVKEAKLGKDVTPHVLRHTCATWALWTGKSLWDVAGVLGADATTVARVYGHHKKIEP